MFFIKIIKRDKKRAAYYKYITDQECGKMKKYYLCLDSCKLEVDKCVELIVSLWKKITFDFFFSIIVKLPIVCDRKV